MKRLALVGLLLSTLAAPSLFAADKQPPDTNALPDLIVSDTLGSQWVVREENLAASFCSVEEGHVTPGYRKLIRFTVTTPNIGAGDVYVGDPNVHVANNDGLFEFAECHNHYHFRHYAKYELVDPKTGYSWRAAKRGFCMLDTDPNPAWLGEPAGPSYFHSCGAVGIPGNQGVSHGWADTYRFFLGGQYFILDGGDGQPVVPAGDYILRITVNPPFVGSKSEPCRALDMKTGLCHQFAESNYANNSRDAIVQIPDHPGRDGVGPLKDTKALGYEPAEHQ
jgi:hypothetical protein